MTIMKVSTLDSGVAGPITLAGNAREEFAMQGLIRAHIFRMLLSYTGKSGTLVDLAAGPCLFSVIARDMGFAVTAVDGRVERKPSDEELGSIKFIHADIRGFDVSRYDIIACLGVFYHLEFKDQVALLRDFAKANVPVILETQVHFDELVAPGETREWARKIVERDGYQGVLAPEGDNPMASIGNPQSFWPTEPSLLRMCEDAGFSNAVIVDPLYQSKYGARRYYLLNCEPTKPDTNSRAAIAERARHLNIVSLVYRERLDVARALIVEPIELPATPDDLAYIGAVIQLYSKSNETSKVIALAHKLRDAAATAEKYSDQMLLFSVQALHKVGETDEAKKILLAPFETRASDPKTKSILKTMLSAAGPARQEAIAIAEKYYPGNLEMLDLAERAARGANAVEASERLCRRALVVRRDDADWLSRLGSALVRQSKLPEAVETFDEVFRIDPQNASAAAQAIPVYLGVKRLENAERLARLLIANSPKNALAHFQLASALRRTGRLDEAQEHAKKAAELEPSNARYASYEKEVTAQPRQKAPTGPAAS